MSSPSEKKEKRTSTRRKSNFASSIKQLQEDIEVYTKELEKLVEEREAEKKAVEEDISKENELIEWYNQSKETYVRKIKELKEKNLSRKEKRMKKLGQKKESLAKLVEQKKQLQIEENLLKQQKGTLKSQEREAKKENRDTMHSLKSQIEENQKAIENLKEEIEKLKINSDKQVETLTFVENIKGQLHDEVKELEAQIHTQNSQIKSLESSKRILVMESKFAEENQIIDLESLLKESRKILEKVTKALKEQKNLNRRSLSLTPISTASLPELSQPPHNNPQVPKSKSSNQIIKVPSNGSSDEDPPSKGTPKHAVERVKSTKKLFKVLGVRSMDDLKEESKGNSYPEDSSGDIMFGDTHRSWIKGGTLNKLIDILLYPQFPNKEFTKIFLSTYYSFSDPVSVTDSILKKIQNDSNSRSPEELTLLKTRASEVIHMWLQNFRSDVEHNEVASIKLLEIIDCLGPLGAELKQLLFMKRTPTIVFEEEAPKIIPPKSTEFIDFSSREVARQMTLIEYAIFNNIRPKECLGVAWNKKHKEIKAPNIYAMVTRFNLVSTWVQSEIVKREKLRDRFVLIKKFLKIAKFCLEMNNFNGVIEILSGLNSSSVFRLRKTWEKIESEAKIISLYEELKELARTEENYKNLREKYAKVGDAPCVPYLGPFFSELNLVEEGNPDFWNGRVDLINFEKKRRLSFVIREMLRYQNNPFNFKVEPKTESFLKSIEKESDDNIYNLSLVAEPKDKERKRATIRASSFSSPPPASPQPVRKPTIGTD